MKNFNEFDEALPFMVTFSHPKYYSGQSTKHLYAPSFNEACLIANNSDYYPLEYPNYTEMDIFIDNQKTGESIYFNELPND